MRRRAAFTVLFFVISPSVQSALANGNQLDYPHSISNGVNCIDCHYAPSVDFLRDEWKNNPPNHIDDTPFNNFCWHCHDGSAAQAVETHSSRTTTPQYAPWNIECIDCHWPHHLVQYRTYGAESFIASGTSTAVDSVSITVGGASFAPNEFQGMVLIPDLAKETFNYKIDSNTTDAIVVTGAIDTVEIAAGKSFAVVYGKLVKATIATPNSGDKQVKFFRNSGANSFADGDATRDGPCEVCHTMTRHFRNDGSAAEQNHENIGGGQQGENCVGACHKHTNGFAHGSGSGGGGCGDVNTCHGLQKSHPTHLGPIVGIDCDGCHDTNNFPFFRDGNTLAATTACDNCHSTDGAATAKQYFAQSGSWAAAEGDQGYCASCHDATPGYTNWDGSPGGSYALNITGDNATYGFFVTGHGRTIVSGNFPNLLWQEINTPDIGNPPAQRLCGDCHDLSSPHFNADPAEKRLKAGFENDASNSNCRHCHEVDGSPVAAVADPQFYTNYADYSNSAHSAKKCSDCHDVHGLSGPDPAMTRGSAEQLCYQCHKDQTQAIADEYGGGFGVLNDALANNRPGGHVSSDDIQEAFSMQTKHQLGTVFTVPLPPPMVGDGNYSLECTSCHNVHVVTGKYWDAELNLSPVSRFPGNSEGYSYTETWGDDPTEKMDAFAAKGTGTGGFYYKIAEGYVLGDASLPHDRPAVYQPPKQGSGYTFEYDGSVLPDYATFCLDCHSYRVSSGIPPVNWGQGISCTDNTVDPPNQRIECGADHGLGNGNMPYYVSDSGTAGFWGSSGNPDVLFQVDWVTRGRHNGHFMRWPYDSAERGAGINYVLACTDCHEAHGSNRNDLIRERFMVTANGDCGTGGNTNPDGENCTDGNNWNGFCNSCHYYYGGQHAGMSCGNASCHEDNSIHRIIHTTDSGGTQLMLTAAGYENDYQIPDFTPEIIEAKGEEGSNQVEVTFAREAFAAAALDGSASGAPDFIGFSGALEPGDFMLTDLNNPANGTKNIISVQHVPGDKTAVLTLDAPLTFDDIYTDILATTGKSVWSWYEGGYNNAATGVIGAQPVSAGPWPIEITPPLVEFPLNEAAGSLTASEKYGKLLSGPVSDASVFQGDGYFHGDWSEAVNTYIEFNSDPTALKAPTALTMEARIFMSVADLDYEDLSSYLPGDALGSPTGPPNGIDDDYDYGIEEGAGNECCTSLGDGRNSTQNRLFERARTIQLTIFRGNWAGDGVAARTGKARVIVKYFVDAASRHDCPNPQWPTDTYTGVDSRWHQISSDIDNYPLVQGHWYKIKAVFNSDKSAIPGSTGAPVDIFVDDQGTDGAGSGELWPGYENVSQTINESASCQWGALPGDFMAVEDQFSFIGDNYDHTDVQGDTNNQLFKGLIDWVTWKSEADYTGVDGLPH